MQVVADASMVLAGQASSGAVLSEEAVRTLPITSRNVYNFHLIGPGVKGLPSTGFGTTQFLVGGHNRMAWSMDGIDNSQRRTNRQIRLVISTPENVEEMQVLSGGYSAEFGRAAGGYINVISRSGTNAFRGGAMSLYRPNALGGAPAAGQREARAEMVDGAGQRRRAARARPRLLLRQLRVQPAEVAAAGHHQPGGRGGHRHSGSDLGNSPFGETFHTPSLKVNFRANDSNSGFLRYTRFTNDQPGAAAASPRRAAACRSRTA